MVEKRVFINVLINYFPPLFRYATHPSLSKMGFLILNGDYLKDEI